jgi:hypothetical protein
MPMRPYSPDWQSVRELAPRRATVGALPERAPGAAAVEAERRAAPLVARGVHRIRIRRVHGHIHHAGVGVHVEDARPRPTTVERAIQSALLVRPPQLAHRGHEDSVAVGRIDHDAPDVRRRAQPHVRERAPTIGALVHTVAPARALPVGALTRAHPHDARVALIERDRPDRVHRLITEQRGPRGAVVGGLVQSTRRRRREEHVRVRLVHGEIHEAAGHGGRPDRARAQTVGERGGGRLGRDRGERGQQSADSGGGAPPVDSWGERHGTRGGGTRRISPFSRVRRSAQGRPRS